MACVPTKDLLRKTRIAIALCGDQDTGKTETLHELARICKNSKFRSVESVHSNNGTDQIFVFEDCGLIVGIGTGGDDAEAIDECFDVFDGKKCDIVFVPTRHTSRHSSWKRFVDRCSSGGYEYKWVGKDKIACPVWHSEVNRQVACTLFGWLQK